jgi:predicted permease
VVRHRVVGVADADFAGAEIGTARPELWVTPGAMRGGDPAVWEAERGHSWLWVIGRRRPGVSHEEARAAARTVHASLAAAYPGLVGETITVVDGVGLRPADRVVAERLVGAFLGVAVLVLLVAASNAAGVQVARALDRRRELTVRVSLGASRPRVLRGLLVEQALLAVAGAGAAFVLTYWSTAWLRASLPYDVSASFRPDARLLLFAFTTAVGVTALVAAVPLWRVAGGAVQRGLRDGGRTHGRQRIGTALVVAQLTVSSALLIVGGVLTRSLLAAAQADPGFSTERVLAVSLRAMPDATGDPAALLDDVRRRIAAVPGVAAVAAADALPVVSPQSTRAVATPDAAYDPDAPRVPAVSAAVDPALFDVLGLRRHGRLFTPDDAAMARAAAGDPVPTVVTASLAERLFGERSAVGQLIQSGPLVARVVGVVDAVAVRSVRDTRTAAMWTPFDAARDTPAEIAVLTWGAPAAVADDIRAALAPLSSSVIVRDIAPLSARVAASLSSTLAGARVTAACDLTALAIAVVGLFGVVASRVARLRREFGVRLALGARPATLVGAVLVRALVPAVAGVSLGIGVVAAGQRQIAPLLFGVSPLDPLVVLLTVAVMSATALVAALGPARRAARTDPLVVIRAD